MPYRGTSALSTAINGARLLYSAYRNYGKYLPTLKPYAGKSLRGTARPAARTTTTTRARPAYRGYRTRRRVYRRRRKQYKLAKVAPRVKQNTVYKRRAKGIRRNNVGLLHLQKRIQSGDALPNQTFARFYYRGSETLDMGVTSTNDPLYSSQRMFCLNDVSSSPYQYSALTDSISTAGGLRGQIMYKELWSSLYSEYQILGAKMNITFKSCVFPSHIASIVPGAAINRAIPLNAQPGYYYARVYYERNGDPVGHPIDINTGTHQQQNFWPHLRDFLADPTVTWKRDLTNLRSKIHVTQDDTSRQLATDRTNTIPIYPSTSLSYELETSNKPVRLTVNFSAKKNFQDKNILHNGPFVDWTSNVAQPGRFMVYFGYIGFNAMGNTAYHMPIDRQVQKTVDVDIVYFACLRGPKIFPSQYTDLQNLAGKIQVLDDIPEDDYVSDDDTDVNPTYTLDDIMEGTIPNEI